VWFKNRKDDGAKLTNIYKPFPRVALALILTAVSIIPNPLTAFFQLMNPKLFKIENCIDEWADGTHTVVPFTQDAYEDIYTEHLEELNRFDEFTKVLKILPSLLQELHDEGR
jgi:hypothetical protein